jgi:hypothetical protein
MPQVALWRHCVGAAAEKRKAEHEHIAATQPGQANPGQIVAKALLLVEVAAQVKLGGVQAEAFQRGQLQLDSSSAHTWWRIVHGVGDHHRAAAVLTDQGGQVLRMIAHPKRGQVQPHSRPPTRPAGRRATYAHAREGVVQAPRWVVPDAGPGGNGRVVARGAAIVRGLADLEAGRQAGQLPCIQWLYFSCMRLKGRTRPWVTRPRSSPVPAA